MNTALFSFTNCEKKLGGRIRRKEGVLRRTDGEERGERGVEKFSSLIIGKIEITLLIIV